MNFYFLKYFVDTYRLKSVTLCAKANSVSTNAISKGIKSLEASLGIELIKHQKNRLIFTKEADRIYNDAINIINQVANLSQSFSPTVHTTKIGVIHSLATGRLSQTISDLARKMDITIQIGNPTEIKNLFSRYLIDIGITIRRDWEVGRNETCLHQGSFGLFSSTEIKADKRIIFMTPDWPEVEVFKKSSDIFVNSEYKICVIDSWDAIYSAVKKGHGYGLLPDYFKIQNKKIQSSNIEKFEYPYSVILKYQNSFAYKEIVKLFEERFK